jgi:pre-mRNA-splicing factor 18
LELLEEKGGGGSGLNDFRKTLANMESSMDEKEAGKLARLTHEKAAAEASKQQSSTEDGPAEEEKETSGKSKDKMKGMEVALIDLKLVKSDPNKLYPLIYYALKVCSSRDSLAEIGLTRYSERPEGVGRVDGR